MGTTSTGRSEAAAWTSRFERVAMEWQALSGRPDDVANWELLRASMADEQRRLISTGRWLSGHEDLLSVIDRRRHELTHSAVVGWLFKPTARHGLGSRVLASLCRGSWPELDVPDGPVSVEREVERSARGDQARADIVVWVGDSIIVIENKVDAEEQPRQAERLHQVWVDEARDVRWLFLTPDGRSPTTTGSAAIDRAWRTLGYRRLAGMITAAVDDAGPSTSLGRRSVEQYLATLRSLYGDPLPIEVGVSSPRE